MKRILVLAVFSSLLAFQMHARILRVNNTPGITAEFATLEAAYTAAQDGDTLYIEGSVTNYLKYGETFTINKSLTLVGPGYWLVENGISGLGTSSAYMGSGTTLKITKANVTLKGLQIRNLEIQASKVTVTRCRVELIVMTRATDIALHQNYITGGLDGANTSKVSITNNIIYSGGRISGFTDSHIYYNHIRIFNITSIYSTTYKNNIVFLTGSSGYKPDPTCLFDSSNFSGNWYLECQGGDNSFDTDKDFQLLTNSDLMTAGSDGKQIGAFGGNDPYVISGVPNVPLIRNVEIPVSANENEGLEVTVTITTER